MSGPESNELMRDWREKLEALRGRGLDAFGARFPVTHWARALTERLAGATDDELKAVGPVPFVGRREVANAYSELNDPIDQLARFQEQAARQARGDDEAHWLDDDYVRALEYGMPPAAVEGIGIERLVMLLADQPSIREVILFPRLRPEAT